MHSSFITRTKLILTFAACRGQTCHNADYTEDICECAWNIWNQNLEAFVENKPFLTLVDKRLGY